MDVDRSQAGKLLARRWRVCAGVVLVPAPDGIRFQQGGFEDGGTWRSLVPGDDGRLIEEATGNWMGHWAFLDPEIVQTDVPTIGMFGIAPYVAQPRFFEGSPLRMRLDVAYTILVDGLQGVATVPLPVWLIED